MKKIDEIYKYLNDNQGREKPYLVSNLVKKFDVTKKSAETYYYKWKREYMKTSKCVPKEIAKGIKALKKVEEVNKPITVNREVTNRHSITKGKDHIAEASKKVDDLEILEEEIIRSIKVKGRNDIYNGKTGLGVALKNGEYKLAFCNIEELTEFYNEYKKVFERI